MSKIQHGEWVFELVYPDTVILKTCQQKNTIVPLIQLLDDIHLTPYYSKDKVERFLRETRSPYITHIDMIEECEMFNVIEYSIKLKRMRCLYINIIDIIKDVIYPDINGNIYDTSEYQKEKVNSILLPLKVEEEEEDFDE